MLSYKPTVHTVPLSQLLNDALNGIIQIPHYPQEYTDLWTSEQQGNLFDSIYCGFPIGNILLWSTKATPGNSKLVLLDGYQRLSTLAAVLGLGLIGNTIICNRHNWVFETQQTSDSRERFIFLGGDEPSDTQVPLSIVLNRSILNSWISKHQGMLGDGKVRLVEAMRDKFSDYTISIGLIFSDSFDKAAELYERVNFCGTSKPRLLDSKLFASASPNDYKKNS